MAIVIDTAIFVTLERQRRPWEEFLEQYFRGEATAISTITASELRAGIYRADSIQRRSLRQTYVEGIIQGLPVLSFDLEVARVHARLWAGLATSGQLIGAHDLVVGATALTHDYAVLTENVREFSRIPGLEVRQPAW